MGKILVEYNGSMRLVNVEMLRQLLRRGLVSMKTRLIIDGREGRVGDIADWLYDSPSPQTPVPVIEAPSKSDAAVEPPPFVDEISVPVPPPRSVPCGKEDDDGMIDLDEFLNFSQGEVKGTSESKKAITSSNIAYVVSALFFIAVVLVLFSSEARQKHDIGSRNGSKEYSASDHSFHDVSSGEKKASEDKFESKPIKTSEAQFESIPFKEPEYEFGDKPFDDSMTSIPKGFKGCNLFSLYVKLKGLFDIKKDEYETTLEFEKRREELENENFQKKVLGEIMLSSRVATEIDSVNQEYNADRAILKLHVYSLNTNSPGVKTDNSWGVIATDECNINYGKDFELEIQPTQARAIRDSIKALLVFTISPEKEKSSDTYKVADYPGVYGKDLEIWFYNADTGEILLKERISGKERKEPPEEKKSLSEKAFDNVFGQSNNSYSNNSYPSSVYQNDVRQDYEPEEEEWDYPETLDETDELERTRRDNKSDKRSEIENVPPAKTWQQLVAESVDEVANWEKKKPALIVPGDCDTLADALEKADSGDVIQLKKNAPSSYSLGVKPGAKRLGIVIDKAVAIVGETGDASDVVIKVGVNESIFVESKSAMFKGITFQCGPVGFGKTYEPIVSVNGSGSATFKYCRFLGEGVDRSVGVQIEGAKANANFWKCRFEQFNVAGLLTKEKGKATLSYCEFLDKNHCGFLAQFDSYVSVERCRFLDNDIGFRAETGGGCKVEDSRFERNDHRTEISAASRNKVEETDNVYDRK